MVPKGNKNSAKKVPAMIVNRRAKHNYEFLSAYEAGIVLQGSEVKSVFAGQVNMIDAHCAVMNNELWLINLDIEPYKHVAASFVPDRRRDRKLLMHRREINQIARKSQEKGLAIVPYKIYFKNGRAKVEIYLARGKKQFDKRRAIKEKDQRRDLKREGLL
ncbi:MAG: SsrA-binding protein SmpB [Armatimonadetes bacterium]|nr:SsrA-binding protein SmpB [Armatimonadota bacterium]